MTISSLAYSPAQMFLDGKAELDVRRQSLLYCMDKKTVRQNTRALEIFYPLLIQMLKTRTQSSLSDQHWLVLTKSIMHVFLVLLIDLETIRKTLRTQKLVDDIREGFALYPQTQENLMQALPYDRTLRGFFLSAAYQISQGKLKKIPTEINLFQIFSASNLKYYLAKKLHRSPSKVAVSSERQVIAVVGASALMANWSPSFHKHYTLVDLDPAIHALYSFPSMPDRALRRIVEQELEDVFVTLNLSKYFPEFGKTDMGAKTLAKLLGTLLPIQIIEKFEQNRTRMEALLKKIKPKLVITSTGHHDDLSNLFLSEAVKQHIPLITLQHGSGYSEYASMQTERSIETGVYPSHYVSWGKGMKSYKNTITKVLPLGSPYLNALKRQKISTKNIRRVLVPLEPIYYYQVLDGFIPSQPGFVARNYRVLIQTMEQLHKTHPDLLFICKVKLGHERQYAIQQYLSDDLKDHVEFTSEGKTLDYFDQETVVLLSQLSGAFHEALMAEIPFVLYLPESQRFLNREIDGFFDELKKHHCCGSTATELVHALSLHLQKKMDYNQLNSSLKRYQEYACRRNPNWQKQLESVISSVLKT